MPDFMVMILESEAPLAPSEMKAQVEGHSAYARKLRARDAWLDGERLRPSAEARRVSVRDGQVLVESGPFETPLAGYYLIKAASLDDAVQLAQECPLSPGAALDVRPLMKGTVKTEKSDQQGHVFAFAVLGNAPNERGWVDIMDRIDAETHAHLPGDGFLGGVRLQPPGSGRRVVPAGNQRAVFDGPFLESKEVIGGLFFMRMAGMEEAVKWASGTRFVQIGAVEIRELWRS